jgi:hypothetical protein
MSTLYSVLLQTGKSLSPGDFTDGMLVSIKQTGGRTVQLLVQGNRAETERVLRGLKDSIRFYERIDA